MKKTYPRTLKCRQSRSAGLDKQHNLKIQKTIRIHSRPLPLHVKGEPSLSRLGSASGKPPKSQVRNTRLMGTAKLREAEGFQTVHQSRVTSIAVDLTRKPRYRGCPASSVCPSLAAASITAIKAQSRSQLLSIMTKWRARKLNKHRIYRCPSPFS